MSKLQINLKSEPRGDELKHLLFEALKRCNAFTLVRRAEVAVNARFEEFLSAIHGKQIGSSQTNEWPGTRLLSGTAQIYRFALDQESIEILLQFCNALYDLVQPNFPEDLCLERPDGTPWFVSISHEKEAYFNLSSEEAEIILSWDWASFFSGADRPAN